MLLYHGTSERYWPRIKVHGLEPRRHDYDAFAKGTVKGRAASLEFRHGIKAGTKQ